jgi:iron complex transport system substrate-binding protein
MKTKNKTWIAVLMAALVLISACAAPAAAPTATPTPEPTPEPIFLTDGLGRAVTLAGPAQRIVSLAPSNTEILYAIGAGAQVAARDDFSNFPEQALNLPSIGGSFSGYNEESIVNLSPDLVLAAEINSPEQVKALEGLGLTVYLLPNPVSLDEMYANLATVGQMTGKEAEAAALVESLKARVAVIEAKSAAVIERPTVFYELDGTDPSAPYTAGSGTFIDTLISMAGGQNIAAAMSAPWGQLSIEEIVVQDPQVILLGDAAYGVTVESVRARTGWSDLAAVRTGRIYPFDDNLVSRPGPRLVDGLEAIYGLLHPDMSQ